MNRIEITTKYRILLVEMITELFPSTSCFSYSDQYGNVTGGEHDYIRFRVKEDNTYPCVHWYEFVMSHLAEEVFKSLEIKYPKAYKKPLEVRFFLREVYASLFGDKKATHPIDYLYSQLKESKKNSFYRHRPKVVIKA